MMMMMMMGAYNGAGSIIHWMTPSPQTSHLKTFWGPKFELPALKNFDHLECPYGANCEILVRNFATLYWPMADIFPLQQDVNRKAALHVYFGSVVAKSIGTAFR